MDPQRVLLYAGHAVADLDPVLADGEVVGEYRLGAKLGEGGFGTVYRAVHTLIGKVAAVKVLRLSYSVDPQIVSRFISEARAVNQIRHRNIIDIFAFGRLQDRRYFFVMELLEGESLQELLNRSGRLSIEQATPILRAIAKAIDAAHAHGIAHRDLKPDNVFLARDGEGNLVPKLLDFGIAKLLDDSQTFHKTRTGAPIGTPHYMSPEQSQGLQVDQRTDTYSFGVLVHRVLTGKLPFDAESVVDVMLKQIHAQPPRASDSCPELPESINEPILALLAKDPTARPSTVEVGLEAVLNAALRTGPLRPAVFADHRPDTLGNLKTLESGPGPPTLLVASSKPEGSHPKPRPSKTEILWASLAVGAAAIAVSVLALDSPTPRPPARAAVMLAPPLPPPTLPEAQAEIQDVELRVIGAPADAELYLGTRRLGHAADPLPLPFGKEPLELTLVAPKFHPLTITVIPDTSQTLTAPPMRRIRAPLPKSPLPREYEDPYSPTK